MVRDRRTHNRHEGYALSLNPANGSTRPSAGPRPSAAWPKPSVAASNGSDPASFRRWPPTISPGCTGCRVRGGMGALEKMMSKAQIGARRLGQSVDGSTNRKTNIPPRWCLSGLSSGPEGADWQPGECDLMTFRRTGLLGTALRTGAASATLAASPAPARGENGGWRRDRDSNPGEAHTPNGFRDRPVRPLRHLSASVVCDGRSSLRVASLQAGTAADRAWRAVGSGGSAPSRSRGGSCRAAPVRRRSSPPLVLRRASAGSRAPLTRPVGSRISPHSGGPSGSAGSMR